MANNLLVSNQNNAFPTNSNQSSQISLAVFNLYYAEIGEEVKYDKKMNFQRNIEQQAKKFGLKEDEVIIIDKKGKSHLYSDKPENENNRFYLFFKKFLKDEHITYLENGITRTSGQIATYYTPSFINNLPVNNIKDLNCDDSDLRKLNDKIQDTLEYTKEQFRKFKVSIKLGEKLKDNLNNQSKATSILVNNVTSIIELTKKNYTKLKEKMESIFLLNETILTQYPTAIDYLKKTPVHKALVKDNVKMLIDIYFDENKMTSWKERCVKNQKYLREKIYGKQDIILSAINKISKEKTASIELMKNEIIERHSLFDSFINIKEQKFIKILSNLTDDAKTLYKFVELGTYSNKNYPKEIVDLQSQYMNIISVNEKHKLANSFVTDMDDELIKMKNLIYKNMNNISFIFSNFYLVKRELNDLLSCFPKYEIGLKKSEEDFDYLNNPTVFPKAYKNSIVEIRRRLVFNKIIMCIIERVHEILNKENDSRKKFIDHYGKYLTNEYVPSLKFINLKLNIDFYNNKEINELPQVMTEEDEEEFRKFNSFLSQLEVKIGKSIDYEENKANSNSNIINNLNSESNVNNINDIKSESGSNSNNNNNVINNSTKDNELNMKTFEEILRLQKIKSSELEQKLLYKEQEIKRLTDKLQDKEKKITEISQNTDKFLIEVNQLTESFLKQITIKDQRIAEISKDIDNLNSHIDKDVKKQKSCFICIDQIKNNVEFENSNHYDSYLNEKLSKHESLVKELETINKDLTCRMIFIKTHFFKYNMQLTTYKNGEIKRIKEDYESKMLELEDHFKSEKEKYEQEFKLKTTYIEKSVNDIQKEVLKLRKEVDIKNQINNKLQNELNEIQVLNKKLSSDQPNIEDLNKQITDLIKENKKLTDQIDSLDTKQKDEYKLLIDNNSALEKEIFELKENIITSKRQLNNEITDLKSEILKYSEINTTLETKLKDEVNDFNKLKREHRQLEDTIEKFKSIKDLEVQSIKQLNSEIEKENIELKKKIEELELSLNNANVELKTYFLSTNNHNSNYNANTTKEGKDGNYSSNVKTSHSNNITHNFSKKTTNFDASEIVKVSHDNFFFDHSTNKLGSTDNNCLTNINLTNLTKMTELEEYVNIKRLDKGNRAIFIPFCEGIYVPICLSNSDDDSKMYFCNYILNINGFDKGIQQEIIENSLIVIGKISKISEYNQKKHGDIPVSENKLMVVDLEKLEYMIGFHSEELVLRNYLL